MGLVCGTKNWGITRSKAECTISAFVNQFPDLDDYIYKFKIFSGDDLCGSDNFLRFFRL